MAAGASAAGRCYPLSVRTGLSLCRVYSSNGAQGEGWGGGDPAVEVLGAHHEPSVVARSRRCRQPQALQVSSYLLSQHPPSPVLQHVVSPPYHTHDRLPTRMHTCED